MILIFTCDGNNSICDYKYWNLKKKSYMQLYENESMSLVFTCNHARYDVAIKEVC